MSAPSCRRFSMGHTTYPLQNFYSASNITQHNSYMRNLEQGHKRKFLFSEGIQRSKVEGTTTATLKYRFRFGGALRVSNGNLTAGRLAKLVGVPWSTIHYWTRSGLLTPVEVKGSSHYRYYDGTSIARCEEIRRLKMKRLNLAEIKEELDRIFGESAPL